MSWYGLADALDEALDAARQKNKREVLEHLSEVMSFLGDLEDYDESEDDD